MALGLDGTASGSGIGAGAATLSTTKTNDIIVVFVAWDAAGTDTIGIADTAMLSWNLRQSETTNSSSACSKEFYAVSAAALTSDIITVTNSTHGTAHVGVMAFAVSGANTSTPYDINASLPAKANTQTNINPVNATISTTATHTIIFGFLNTQSTGNTFLYNPSAAQIMAPLTYNSQQIASWYVIETSAQTGVSVGASESVSGATTLIGDAIQVASAPANASNMWF